MGRFESVQAPGRQETPAPDASGRVVFTGFFACQPHGARINRSSNGEVAEWSNAAVLKTVERESVPGVRIPVSPPLAFIETRMRPDAGVIFFMFQRGLGLATEPALPIFCRVQSGLAVLIQD